MVDVPESRNGRPRAGYLALISFTRPARCGHDIDQFSAAPPRMREHACAARLDARQCRATQGALISWFMDDFRIEPPLVVNDTPKPRRLSSLAEARAFHEDGMRIGRPPPWRRMYYRLRAVRSEDEAIEAIGALRELLEFEELFVHPNLPLELQRHSD
jgi:hypothetical protein